MNSFELRISVASPSPNKWLNQHWSVYNDIKKRWFKLISEAVLLSPDAKFHREWPRVAVEIKRYAPRLLDPDNLTGGVKPLIDVMRSGVGRHHMGLFLDDDPKHLELQVSQSKGPAETVITVTRLDNG